MSTPKETAEEVLTTEQIDEKVKVLAEREKTNVYPIAFMHNGAQILGYIKEPMRIVKMRALDKVMTSPSSAGEDLLLACLLKEDSDPKILSQSPEHDNIYIGACLAAAAIVEVSVNTYKKK